MDTACDDRREGPEAMKNVQECWQTWETPDIVSTRMPQVTVKSEVYMRSPWVTSDQGGPHARFGAGHSDSPDLTTLDLLDRVEEDLAHEADGAQGDGDDHGEMP
jgi:hypothetical protein